MCVGADEKKLMKRLKEELRERDQGGIGIQRGGLNFRARVRERFLIGSGKHPLAVNF